MAYNASAIVVLSGGQDSTTCLYWAIRQYGRGRVSAVGFSYGQRHANELDYAKKICAKEEIDYHILDMALLGQLAPNALTRSNIEIESSYDKSKYPNTFVDGRNHLFLSFAAIFAKQQGIHDIVTGVCQTDFSGYPDCRDVFVKSLSVTLSLAMDYDFQIQTPLMWLDKAAVWALADELGCLETIRHETLTCYQGIPGKGCGKCPACQLRNNGYDEFIKRRQQDANS